MSRDIYEHAAQHVDAARSGLAWAYGEQQRIKPYEPNTTIEDLVNGSLAHRGPHAEVSTEQKALDGIATVVMRELSNRTKEITRLRDVETMLHKQLSEAHAVRVNEQQQFKLDRDALMRARDAANETRNAYSRVIKGVQELLPEKEYDLEETPKVLRDMLDTIVQGALNYGVFDDSTDLWLHLAKVTGRDPDTGNRLSDHLSDHSTYGTAAVASIELSGGTATVPYVARSFIELGDAVKKHDNKGVLSVSAVEKGDTDDA
jgi:hypothetical protein